MFRKVKEKYNKKGDEHIYISRDSELKGYEKGLKIVLMGQYWMSPAYRNVQFNILESYFNNEVIYFEGN